MANVNSDLLSQQVTPDVNNPIHVRNNLVAQTNFARNTVNVPVNWPTNVAHAITGQPVARAKRPAEVGHYTARLSSNTATHALLQFLRVAVNNAQAPPPLLLLAAHQAFIDEVCPLVPGGTITLVFPSISSDAVRQLKLVAPLAVALAASDLNGQVVFTNYAGANIGLFAGTVQELPMAYVLRHTLLVSTNVSYHIDRDFEVQFLAGRKAFTIETLDFQIAIRVMARHISSGTRTMLQDGYKFTFTGSNVTVTPTDNNAQGSSYQQDIRLWRDKITGYKHNGYCVAVTTGTMDLTGNAYLRIANCAQIVTTNEISTDFYFVPLNPCAHTYLPKAWFAHQSTIMHESAFRLIRESVATSNQLNLVADVRSAIIRGEAHPSHLALDPRDKNPENSWVARFIGRPKSSRLLAFLKWFLSYDMEKPNMELRNLQELLNATQQQRCLVDSEELISPRVQHFVGSFLNAPPGTPTSSTHGCVLHVLRELGFNVPDFGEMPIPLAHNVLVEHLARIPNVNYKVYDNNLNVSHQNHVGTEGLIHHIFLHDEHVSHSATFWEEAPPQADHLLSFMKKCWSERAVFLDRVRSKTWLRNALIFLPLLLRVTTGQLSVFQATMIFQTSVAAPVVEEALKHLPYGLGRFYGILIPFFEFYGHLDYMTGLYAWRYRHHMSWAEYPLFDAMTFHALSNTLALFGLNTPEPVAWMWEIAAYEKETVKKIWASRVVGFFLSCANFGSLHALYPWAVIATKFLPMATIPPPPPADFDPLDTAAVLAKQAEFAKIANKTYLETIKETEAQHQKTVEKVNEFIAAETALAAAEGRTITLTEILQKLQEHGFNVAAAPVAAFAKKMLPSLEQISRMMKPLKEVFKQTSSFARQLVAPVRATVKRSTTKLLLEILFFCVCFFGVPFLFRFLPKLLARKRSKVELPKPVLIPEFKRIKKRMLASIDETLREYLPLPMKVKEVSGQKKLLEHETALLQINPHHLIVYVGCSPGTHFGTLLQRFPNITIHGYDPQPCAFKHPKFSFHQKCYTLEDATKYQHFNHAIFWDARSNQADEVYMRSEWPSHVEILRASQPDWYSMKVSMIPGAFLRVPAGSIKQQDFHNGREARIVSESLDWDTEYHVCSHAELVEQLLTFTNLSTELTVDLNKFRDLNDFDDYHVRWFRTPDIPKAGLSGVEEAVRASQMKLLVEEEDDDVSSTSEAEMDYQKAAEDIVQELPALPPMPEVAPKQTVPLREKKTLVVNNKNKEVKAFVAPEVTVDNITSVVELLAENRNQLSTAPGVKFDKAWISGMNTKNIAVLNDSIVTSIDKRRNENSIETLKKGLNIMWQYSKSKHTKARVLVLDGVAGSGKSSFAHTLFPTADYIVHSAEAKQAIESKLKKADVATFENGFEMVQTTKKKILVIEEGKMVPFHALFALVAKSGYDIIIITTDRYQLTEFAFGEFAKLTAQENLIDDFWNLLPTIFLPESLRCSPLIASLCSFIPEFVGAGKPNKNRFTIVWVTTSAEIPVNQHTNLVHGAKKDIAPGTFAKIAKTATVFQGRQFDNTANAMYISAKALSAVQPRTINGVQFSPVLYVLLTRLCENSNCTIYIEHTARPLLSVLCPNWDLTKNFLASNKKLDGWQPAEPGYIISNSRHVDHGEQTNISTVTSAIGLTTLTAISRTSHRIPSWAAGSNAAAEPALIKSVARVEPESIVRVSKTTVDFPASCLLHNEIALKKQNCDLQHQFFNHAFDRNAIMVAHQDWHELVHKYGASINLGKVDRHLSKYPEGHSFRVAQIGTTSATQRHNSSNFWQSYATFGSRFNTKNNSRVASDGGYLLTSRREQAQLAKEIVRKLLPELVLPWGPNFSQWLNFYKTAFATAQSAKLGHQDGEREAHEESVEIISRLNPEFCGARAKTFAAMVLKTQFGKSKAMAGQPVTSSPTERTKMPLDNDDVDVRVALEIVMEILQPFAVITAEPGGNLRGPSAWFNHHHIGTTVFELDETAKDTNYNQFTISMVAEMIRLQSEEHAEIFLKAMERDVFSTTLLSNFTMGLKAMAQYLWLSGNPPTLKLNCVTSTLSLIVGVLFDIKPANNPGNDTFICGSTLWSIERRDILLQDLRILSTGDDISLRINGVYNPHTEQKHWVFSSAFLDFLRIQYKIICRGETNWTVHCHHLLIGRNAYYDPVRAFVKIMDTQLPVINKKIPAENVDEFVKSIGQRTLPLEFPGEVVSVFAAEHNLSKAATISCIQHVQAFANCAAGTLCILMLENTRSIQSWSGYFCGL